MRLATVTLFGRSTFGVVDGDVFRDLGASGRWPDLATALGSSNVVAFQEAAASAPEVALDDVQIDLPIPKPGRILCVGLNYHDHRAESVAKPGEHPTIFTRFVSSLVPDGVPIERTHVSTAFDYEGELAVVIGKPGRYIAADRALEHVGGYSCFNDGTIRDYQRHASQFIPGKNFERSGSFGPWLVTPDEFDPSTAELRTLVNGNSEQHAPITDMIHDTAQLIAYCSIFTTLEPGDVIATGTPGGVGYARKPPLLLVPGDTVEVVITGIGTLTNQVIDEPR